VKATIRHSLVAALGIVALTFAVAPVAAHATVPKAGTIKLGYFGPLTGSNAVEGIDMENAAKLAIDNWNKKGGVLGDQITLDAQDSPCVAAVAVQAAQKLVTDGVVGVVGPYCSSDAIPASVIYHRAGIPFITGASTNPKLTEQGFDDVFRTVGRDDEQGVFAASIMAGWHAKRIAIVHDNTTYAHGLATQTQVALAKHPGMKVVFFDAIVPGSRDFTAILTRIRSVKPDVTYFTGYVADGGLFVKQFVSLGVPGRIMAGDANNGAEFISLAGKASEKAFITGALLPQMVPSAAGFVKQFTAKYHLAPGPYSGYTYDAMNILLYAIQKTGSTNGATLVRFLKGLKNYPGVTGPITFTSTGDRKQIQYTLLTVRHGQFVRAM